MANRHEVARLEARIAALERERDELRSKAADAYGSLSEVAECLCMGQACEKDFLKGFEAVQLIGKEPALARAAAKKEGGG